MLFRWALLIGLLLSMNAWSAAPRLQVNQIGCSLFDMQGKLLKRHFGWACAFFSNGSMLIADGFTLSYYDKKMNLRWSKDRHVHHTMTLADDNALVLTSWIKNGDTRLDRLEVYGREGKLLRHFNFTPEMSISVHQYSKNLDQFALPRVKQEITYAVSLHRIPPNRSPHPAFKAGNYVVSDLGSNPYALNRIYFFDEKLERLVHTVSARSLKRGAMFDVQVTKDGNLLIYKTKNSWFREEFSSVEEINPLTYETVWTYAGPPRFYSAYEGNVQYLPNGNILFSSLASFPEPHVSTEITRAGKVVWQMTTVDKDLTGKPNVVRRLDLTDYYQAKGDW